MPRKELVLAGLALLLVACGGGGGREPERIEPKIYPQTRVLSAETRKALTGFTLTNAPACLEHTNPNRPPCQATLTFSGSSAQLAQLAVGQILVSEPTPKAPYGLLQKVMSIQQAGNTLTVQTEEANIGEAIEQGEAEFRQTLKPGDLQAARALAQSVRFSNGLSSYSSQSGVRPMLSLDFSFNEVLYDQDNNPSTTGDQVRVQGKLLFDVQNGFDAGVSWKKVLGVPTYPNGVYFKAALGIKYESEVRVSSGVSFSLSKEIKLAEYTFQPITVFVGPVPLVFVPQLVVKASASGQIAAEISYAATLNIGAQACMEYKSGFSNCSTFGKNLSAGPTSAKVSANARASLLGEANVLLYGVVGPYAKVGPYLELDAQIPRNPVWKLNAGIEAFLGLQLGIDFGPVDFSLNWDFKFWDENLGTLAQSPPQPPILNFYQAGIGTVQIMKPVTLCASAIDPQDGPRPTSLSSNLSGDNPLAGFPASSNPVCQSYTFTSEGPRTLSASATNSANLSASKTLSLNVQDPPPSVEIYNPKPMGSYYAGGTVLLQGFWLDPSLDTQDCTKAVWKSNVPGDILPANACGTPTVKLSNSTASRTLTLEVSNARNKKGSASVSLSVLPAPANHPPQVNITQPNGNLPELSTSQIVLKGWVLDQENESVNYIWKIAELSSVGVPGPQQNVPGGSGTVFFTSSGTNLPTVTIANLTTLFPSPGCGRSYRLFLEATDSQPGPPPRPVVATQDFRLAPCIN